MRVHTASKVVRGVYVRNAAMETWGRILLVIQILRFGSPWRVEGLNGSRGMEDCCSRLDGDSIKYGLVADDGFFIGMYQLCRAIRVRWRRISFFHPCG